MENGDLGMKIFHLFLRKLAAGVLAGGWKNEKKKKKWTLDFDF